MRLFTKVMVLGAAIVLLFSAGCKKGSPNASLLVLNIHTKVGADSLVLGSTYQNSSGRNISFSRVEYYLSGFQLISSDNYVQPVSGEVLVTDQNSQYIIGSVPVGIYKSISFNVGLADTSNHNDPATYANGSPLAPQNPTMHFASNSLGYIFMAVEGLVDSSLAGTGVPGKPFSYHVGADSLLRRITLPDHSAAPYNATFNAAGNQTLSIDITADLGSLLKNIDMNANSITNTADYPVLADTLANHIPAMFSYQQ